MEKNNVGEAILISTVIVCLLYFETSTLQFMILLVLALVPFFTWVTIDKETRNIQNQFAQEESRLKNEKLRLEIKKLKKELEE